LGQRRVRSQQKVCPVLIDRSKSSDRGNVCSRYVERTKDPFIVTRKSILVLSIFRIDEAALDRVISGYVGYTSRDIALPREIIVRTKTLKAAEPITGNGGYSVTLIWSYNFV
jgi:hypothetical protein